MMFCRPQNLWHQETFWSFGPPKLRLWVGRLKSCDITRLWVGWIDSWKSTRATATAVQGRKILGPCVSWEGSVPHKIWCVCGVSKTRILGLREEKGLVAMDASLGSATQHHATSATSRHWTNGASLYLVQSLLLALPIMTDIQHPDMESSYLNNPIRNPTFRKDIYLQNNKGTLIHQTSQLFITIFFETMVSWNICKGQSKAKMSIKACGFARGPPAFHTRKNQRLGWWNDLPNLLRSDNSFGF